MVDTLWDCLRCWKAADLPARGAGHRALDGVRRQLSHGFRRAFSPDQPPPSGAYHRRRMPSANVRHRLRERARLWNTNRDARGLRPVLLFAAFCRAALVIFRWFINYLGLWQSWGQGFEPPQLHHYSRFIDTRQAMPAQDRLPRSLFDPDLLKKHSHTVFRSSGFPVAKIRGCPFGLRSASSGRLLPCPPGAPADHFGAVSASRRGCCAGHYFASPSTTISCHRPSTSGTGIPSMRWPHHSMVLRAGFPAE